MKILIVNQYNSDNLGDKLLNKMICSNIIELGYKYINAGFAQTINQTINYKNTKKINKIFKKIKKRVSPFSKYILMYKKRLNKIQKKEEILNCNALIIGGGQLIKHHSVFTYCMINWIRFAKKRNIPILIYGVSMDSNLNSIEKLIYRKAMKNVDLINVRDYQTAELMKRYFNIKVHVSPDIAFTYYKYIKTEKRTKKNNDILVLPYDLLTAKYSFSNKETQRENYEKIIDRINQENTNSKSQSIILTATTSSDLEECHKFYNYLNNKGYNSKIIKANNINELTDLIWNCKVLITGRMHAMIMGLVCKRKVSPIVISNKIAVFKNEYLDNKTINIEKISKNANEGLNYCLNKLFK